ncbi:hypothetical protein ACFQX7_10480 [Luedemannella flava]
MLLLGATVVGILTGKLRLPTQAAGETDVPSVSAGLPTTGAAATSDPVTSAPPTTAGPTSAAPTSVPPSTAPVTASVDPESAPVVSDSLAAEGSWINSTHSRYDATCRLDGALTVTTNHIPIGSFRCQGPEISLTNFTVAVDATIPDANSCAGIWFRFINNRGYALQVCKDKYVFLTHAGSLSRLRTMPFAEPLADGAKVHVVVRAHRNTFLFFKGDELIGQHTDSTYAKGRVILGVFVPSATSVAPVTTQFNDITIWKN